MRPALYFLVAAVGVVALSSYLLEASLHAFPGNSDSATAVLEGAAISHGHFGLHGWSLTADSFWSVDAPFYAVATSVVGVRAVLMNAVPAVIAALMIAVGAVFATFGLRRRAGVPAAIFVLTVLCLPGPVLAYFLLQGPWHVATTLWCVLAFVALSRSPTRLNLAVAVGFLAAGLLGDPITLAIGCVPLLVLGLLGVRDSRRDPGTWRPIYAVGASVVVALVVRIVAYVSGGFAVVARHDPVTLGQMRWNIGHLVPILSALFGAGSLPVGTPQTSVLFQFARAIAELLTTLGVVAALVQLVRRIARPRVSTDASYRVDDLLVVAFLADLATFVFASSGPGANNARYLVPAVIFGSLLGGRFVGRLVASIRDRRQLVAIGTAAVALVASFAIGPTTLLRASRPSQPAVELTAFLEHRGLTEGIGDYWSSSIVTVESREDVLVRPVVASSSGQLVRDDRQSDASWYADKGFEFVVYDPSRPDQGVDFASASTTFGKPAHVFDVGSYRLLAWDHPVYVSADIREPSSPLHGFWEP